MWYFIFTIVCIILDLGGFGYQIYRCADIPVSVRFFTKFLCLIGAISSYDNIPSMCGYDIYRFLLHSMDFNGA